MTLTLERPASSLTREEMQALGGGRDLVAELERVVTGEVRFDAYSRMLYSTDASLYQIQPVGVVIPKTIDDVQATVEIAVRHGVPVLPRGGGSSLAGQTVGQAIVIDFSKYMDAVLDFDAEARTVRVEPGINFTALNQLMGVHGLMIGPDPASANRATIGGSIANNATGSHSILYGMMADNVIDTDVILADASMARFGPVAPENLDAFGRADTLEGRIYHDVPAIVRGVTDEIRAHWPKHWRRASGYSLDRLAAALMPPGERSKLSFDSRFRPPVADPTLIDKFNIAQLFTGSEGTLGIMTASTVPLVAKPKRTGLSVVHFERLLDACAATPDILETDPSACELLDKQLMDLARAQPEWAKRLHFVQGDPAAVLLVEFYGEDERDVAAKLDRFAERMRARGHGGAIATVVQPARQAEVWEVRKAGLNLLNSRRGPYKPIPGIEDVSVPPEQLAAYLGKILDFAERQGDIPEVAVYAHASAGCLHVRPLINTKTARGVKLMQVLGEYACDVAVSFGGTMSGEHGDGLARSALNPRLFGPILYGALQEVKRTFDPDGLMNPGKVVDAPPLTQNLRFGPDYETIELKTIFDWRDDFGFAGAIEMCNGAGVCRKLGSGSMCPSYMATRDEKDTTRGRANALRNALAGRIPHDELFTDEMNEVMELCLGCKACSSECPSAVDMAKIKAEYYVHYYRRNGLPLFNRLMGLLPVVNMLLYRFGRPFIPLVNWGMKMPLVKAVFSAVGVHPSRSMPGYAPQTFAQWFAQQGTSSHGEEDEAFPNGPVILFHDTWTNFNETEIGRDAVRVLRAAGYRVFIPTERKCCGRPLITGGQADKAKPWADHNVALLAPYAKQGIPIIGIEPSCILTLRDEYLTLASDRRRAKLVADHAFTFEEFVAAEREAGRFNAPWQDDAGKALLHGHCHHKALVGNEVTVATLQAAGYDVEVISSGCCGMAGDFGYEAEHYDVSVAVAEDRLMPAVRGADDDAVIVASGTSCRHQIRDLSDRQPVHLIEALAAALEELQQRNPDGYR